jgi:hypothetical protein
MISHSAPVNGGHDEVHDPCMLRHMYRCNRDGTNASRKRKISEGVAKLDVWSAF